MDAPTDSQTTDATDSQHSTEMYLPAMPSFSADPGPIERFLSTLLRRRGGLRPVGRSE